jgi:hypothetical protein
VIGYDIFLKFEIELNPVKQTITFRPAATADVPTGYAHIPLRLVDSRPVLDADIMLGTNKTRKYELMIDTGSAVGLLLKTTQIDSFHDDMIEYIIGHGFNGPISGYKTEAGLLQVRGINMHNLPTGIIKSQWHDYASIGMEILKDYVLVLNYCKSYACLKKIANV